MKSKIIALLLAVFAFVSCTDEDLQNVAFEKDLITVDAEAQSVTVYIKANCPWYISTDAERAYATSTYGEGNAIIEIAVMRNVTYDEGNYIFTLTSGNGKEQATLLIVQEPQIKMEYTTDGPVPAEGGNYSITLNTNDDVVCTELPEWVTHVSGRGLSKHTYTFECQANRTGEPRYGSVLFTGRKDEYVINIKQDSFTPDSVYTDIPDKFLEGLTVYKFPMQVTPVFADLGKLQATVTNNGKAWFDNGNICIQVPEYGKYTLTVYSLEKLVYKQTFTVQPVEAVLYVANNQDFCLGQTAKFTDSNCTLTFDNPQMVQRQADGSYKFIREGSLHVTAVNQYSGDFNTITVHVARVVLKMESSRVTSGANMNQVSILFSATGYDIENYKFYLTETGSNVQLDAQSGTAGMNGSQTLSGLQTFYYRTSEEAVSVLEPEPVRYLLDKYTLNFTATINGTSYSTSKKF